MNVIASSISEHSDEELCALAADGCRDAEEELVKRYLRPVRVCARPYFLAGGDSEDLIQEAMFLASFDECKSLALSHSA